MCLRGGMPKTTTFSVSLSRGTSHATSECQTEVRENAMSKYHFPFLYVLICRFNRFIHLWSIGGRIMMINLELFT